MSWVKRARGGAAGGKGGKGRRHGGEVGPGKNKSGEGEWWGARGEDLREVGEGPGREGKGVHGAGAASGMLGRGAGAKCTRAHTIAYPPRLAVGRAHK